MRPASVHCAAFAVLLLLSTLLGTLLLNLWGAPPLPAAPVDWAPQVRWLAPATPSYRLYLRQDFELTALPESAWLRLSADSDYILYVNGDIISQELSTPRNTLGLGERRSDLQQNFNDSLPYPWLIPDWIQIASPRDWRVTTYVDLTAHLQVGHNVIAIEAQKNRPSPRLVVEGYVQKIGGDRLDLSTGAAPWRIGAGAENRQGSLWFEPDFAVAHWPPAPAGAPIQMATFSRLRSSLFDRPLQGQWISRIPSDRQEVWLRRTWSVPQYHRALLRMAGDTDYALLVNGRRVTSLSNDGNQLHLYDLTHLLHPGDNTLAVRLAGPILPNWAPAGKDTLSPDGLPRFFADAWVESAQGEVLAELATDGQWQALMAPVPGWAEGEGPSAPVLVLRSPQPQTFQRIYEGDAARFDYPRFLGTFGRWQLIALGLVGLYAWGLGWGCTGTPALKSTLPTGAALLTPSTFWLMGMGLLKHRYGEAERGLWFAQSHGNAVILLGALALAAGMILAVLGQRQQGNTVQRSRWRWVGSGAIAAAVFLICLGPTGRPQLGFLLLVATVGMGAWRRPDLFRRLQQRLWSNLGTALPSLRPSISLHQWVHPDRLMVLVTLIAFGLRLYRLTYSDPEPDENVSWDATKGILRTGAPISASGVWYTRGPFYHYLLAIWLRVLGDSFFNARLMSVVWGTATLVLIYCLARRLTGRPWLALLVTILMALDPWEIWYSRNIRFYQITQFMTLVAFWAFLEGFIERRGRGWQYLFFVALVLCLTTQEVSLMLLPGFLGLFLFFYRPVSWSKDWPILVGAFMTMAIFAFNIYFVKIKSLTPLVGLSSFTTSFIKFHFNSVSTFFTNFFVGVNRMYTLYSVGFLLGLGHAFWQRDRSPGPDFGHRIRLYIYAGLLANILLVTVMVFLRAPRYIYPVYPLFVLLAVDGLLRCTADLARVLQTALPRSLRLQPLLVTMALLLLAANIEPGRVLASYGESITPRHREAALYVQAHRQPGDVVIANVPAGHANISGGADYYLVHRMSFFDAVYQHDGRLIDRWEGGQVLDNLDQLSRILATADRVWLHTFDRQLPKDPELAKFFNQLQTLGTTALDTYGTRVRLWQRTDGVLPRVPNRGRDLGAY